MEGRPMGLIQKKLVIIPVSVIICFFLFSLFYLVRNYCDGIPYPLLFCSVFRLGYYSILFLQTLTVLFTHPGAFFQILFTDENPLTRGILTSAFIDIILFCVTVAVLTVVLSKLTKKLRRPQTEQMPPPQAPTE